MQLLNCGLPWQFIMRAESRNLVLLLKGVIKTYPIWFSLVLSKNKTIVSHIHKCHFFFLTKLITSSNHIPPASGPQNYYCTTFSQVSILSDFFFHLNMSYSTFLTFHCSNSIKMPFILIRSEDKVSTVEISLRVGSEVWLL